MGSAAIQLAVASGLDVVTTALKRKFDYCKKLGTTDVFDYRSPSIVENSVAALHKGTVAGAFDGRTSSIV